MRFWVREVAGWCLVGLGLAVFYICLQILLQDGPWLFEAIFLTVIGVVVFRAGIHLLKVAVAARICLHAHALAGEGASPSSGLTPALAPSVRPGPRRGRAALSSRDGKTKRN